MVIGSSKAQVIVPALLNPTVSAPAAGSGTLPSVSLVMTWLAYPDTPDFAVASNDARMLPSSAVQSAGAYSPCVHAAVCASAASVVKVPLLTIPLAVGALLETVSS